MTPTTQAVWTMLTREVAYHDRGSDYYTERLNLHGKARQARRLLDQLHQLGYQATLQPIEPG